MHNPHLRELDSVHTHPRKGWVCPLFLILPTCLYDSGTLLTMPRDSYLRRKSCLQTARLFLGLPGVRKELSPAKHECCVASVHRGRRGMWDEAGPVRVSPAQRHMLILQTFHSLLKVSLSHTCLISAFLWQRPHCIESILSKKIQKDTFPPPMKRY